ncbi:nuclear transport factor 2 isoform X1 [Brienomyrus brachyistius]|uniref:nuclear transport factor 2 isoform X1 n=1 Tax=Brienomyrus brachyistius TaxID=42636 RepID=UPI0020B3A91D|nr:nuclear transport factor 2 isoform X1 [Brienomyrus brachyistius]
MCVRVPYCRPGPFRVSIPGLAEHAYHAVVCACGCLTADPAPFRCPFPDWLCSRVTLFVLQIDASCLTWEGQQFQGKAAIVEKLSSLPFTKIAHNITAQDHQPTPDSCILSMVVGQLKADEDPIMGFHQIFLLKNINDAWVCTNDMFRLAIHNFG